MKNFLLLALTTTLLFPTSSQSNTNHFGAGGVFELDLGDSEIPLTPKQERNTNASLRGIYKEKAIETVSMIPFIRLCF